MINKKSIEFAKFIKSSDEFKNMTKAKAEIDKNKTLKKQLQNYLERKNDIYSRYSSNDVKKKLIQLNSEYEEFFNIPKISNYIEVTEKFNALMNNIYSVIEKELLKD